MSKNRHVRERVQDKNTEENRKKSKRVNLFYYTALAVAHAVLLVPIWGVRHPGLMDYPNHLTRCYILAHYAQDAIWQQRYSISYVPAPNLAIDLVTVLLQHWLSLEVGGKIFLSIVACCFVLGCSELGRTIAGRPNPLAILAALTLYNSECRSTAQNHSSQGRVPGITYRLQYSRSDLCGVSSPLRRHLSFSTPSETSPVTPLSLRNSSYNRVETSVNRFTRASNTTAIALIPKETTL
jgi:hypothetical protein